VLMRRSQKKPLFGSIGIWDVHRSSLQRRLVPHLRLPSTQYPHLPYTLLTISWKLQSFVMGDFLSACRSFDYPLRLSSSSSGTRTSKEPMPRTRTLDPLDVLASSTAFTLQDFLPHHIRIALPPRFLQARTSNPVREYGFEVDGQRVAVVASYELERCLKPRENQE
jgi:hypothetical protein